MRFQLVALSGTKYDDEAYEVVLPTQDGEIGVMPGHMPLVSVAKAGVIMIRKKSGDSDASRDLFAISGGLIEVSHDSLRVLVDEADHADTINEAEAQAAYDRAQQLMGEAKDQVSLEHAQQLVDRHAVRIQVANLKRRHQRK